MYMYIYIYIYIYIYKYQGPRVAPGAPEPPTKGSEAGGALAGAPLEEPAPEPQDRIADKRDPKP